MTTTLADAKSALLQGNKLAWSKFEDHKAGAIELKTAEQRRLCRFLLEQPTAKLLAPDESIFSGVITAWSDVDDPATSNAVRVDHTSAASWRLVRLEASGFGGLTVFGGPVFDTWIGGENWCLEGQNGSGKTSFTNAIIWALTGQRLREQDGLILDKGHRTPVYSDTGTELGTWPSLISYPEKVSDLSGVARTWVRLTFSDGSGQAAIAYRETTAPLEGEPQTTSAVDPRLTANSQLIETGLLMPARLPRVGFGSKSQSLYEAVKLLTGLDHLGDVAEAARLLTNKAQPFLKYAKQNGIEREEAKFRDNIRKIDEQAAIVGIDISNLRTLGPKTLASSLKDLADATSAKAGELLITIKAELADRLDIAKPQARTQIKQAVATARAILNLGTKDVPVFEAWSALKAAKDDASFSAFPDVVSKAKTDLAEAIHWHSRQLKDHRLRLKALAAQYYVATEPDSVSVCPLCLATLTSTQQLELKTELAELKQHSDLAERKLADVCAAIEKQLTQTLTPSLQRHRELLANIAPKEAYAAAVRARFTDQEPFKSTLVGIAQATEATLGVQQKELPTFEHPQWVSRGDEAPAASDVLKTIHTLERLYALALWWSQHGSAFRDAWITLVQKKDAAGAYQASTLLAQLEQLEVALDKAEPLDQAAKNLVEASVAAGAWRKIQEKQDIRDAIANALEPLKLLRLLVNAETASSIAGLSDRMKAILNRVHLKERLDYAAASLQKKEIHIDGSLEPGMRIDAALVANTSWLRAILWSFVLALREQTLNRLATNPFPLLVMDDPQATFDPRNKRKWAEVLAAQANASPSSKQSAQLILTTHEQQFFKFLVNEQKLSGQQGLIAAVNKVNRVATIANGSSLVRSFDSAIAANDDALAHKYVSDVRIYCEDLLKCIMRVESPNIANMNLDSLKKELKKLREAHVRPFDRAPFAELASMLLGGGGGPVKLINDSHHQYDGTIGVAQAQDVRLFWENKLQPKLHQAFLVYDQFEAYSGDPRMFSWNETTVNFPPSQKDQVGRIELLNTGVAAAAKSDGRAGDGEMTIQQWESSTPINLFNHEIYQLAQGTLEPVASVRDLLIVSNYAPVTPRSLVVAAFGNKIFARRYNTSDLHPDIAILTGNTLEPHETPIPLIAPREKLIARKVVGTIFAPRSLALPTPATDMEVAALPDLARIEAFLSKARLFEVKGRSAEPIALDTQFLITHEVTFGSEALRRLDGCLIVAIDENGARYFKRLRVRRPLIILESLNPDGTTASELLSLDEGSPYPRLTGLLEVIGVLFELPKGKAT